MMSDSSNINKIINKKTKNNIGSKNSLENFLDCDICFNRIDIGDNIVILPCQHYFCYECINEWVKKRNICPSCQNDNDDISLIKSKDSRLVKRLKRDYKKYIKSGGIEAPKLDIYNIYSDIKFDFNNINFGENDKIKFMVVDKLTKKKVSLDWNMINDVNDRFFRINEFINLSYINVYIQHVNFTYRFHIEIEMFNINKYRASIKIIFSIDKPNYDNIKELTYHVNAKSYFNKDDPFLWGTIIKKGERRIKKCKYCKKNTGAWKDTGTEYGLYNNFCHHDNYFYDPVNPINKIKTKEQCCSII
jgi:hypothetical protein